MTVALVGAGPGDPGLITVRGLERLRSCDAVVYDRLVAPELVDEAPADALRIPRDGLSTGARSTSCSSSSDAQGLDVVRLKGGDPYVFGRGGEEALALAEAGDPVRGRPGHLLARRRARRRGHPGDAPRGRRHGHDRDRPRRRRLAARLRGARRGRRDARAVHGARAAAASWPTAWSRAGHGGRTRPPPSSRAARCPTRRSSPRRSTGSPTPRAGFPGRRSSSSATSSRYRGAARLPAAVGGPGLQHAPDPAHGLADAVLVLDEREADEALAARAEARPRGRRRPCPRVRGARRRRASPSPRTAPGTGAHANIVPRGFGNDQPARSRPSQSASRRER